jgi:hypothetical protein
VDRPRFNLVIEPMADGDPVPAIRRALKLLRRSCGLRCLAITERLGAPGDGETPAGSFPQVECDHNGSGKRRTVGLNRKGEANVKEDKPCPSNTDGKS